MSNYIEDEGDFNFGKSKIEMNVNEETNMVSFMGFYQGLLKDSFISVNTDIDEFLEDLDKLNALLKVGLEVEFQSKKGDPLKTNTLYEAIEIADKKVRSVNRIGRFKGLGESSPKDLWDTSLNPETRKIIRIMPTDNMHEMVNNFMGKKPEFRKEFLKEVFAKVYDDV